MKAVSDMTLGQLQAHLICLDQRQHNLDALRHTMPEQYVDQSLDELHVQVEQTKRAIRKLEAATVRDLKEGA